jgi:chromosome segregation ATPase
LEETRLKLVACEEGRRSAEDDAKKHHGELRSLKQQFVELKTSHSELTSKYESTQTEIVSFKQSNTTLKKEKHEWMHEKGELEERLKKCNYWNEELKRKVKEITESYEKKVREVHELQETISKTKYENEELHQKVKELRRELEEEHSRWEDAEDRCGKWKLKWEHLEREIVSVREELQIIEIEQTKLQEIITKKTEELRRVIIEKERFEEDYHGACKRAEDCHREILVLQESLRRTESTLKEKTELVHTLRERIERIECERDEAHNKCRDLSIEISELQTSIVSLKLEIETVTEERESFCEKYRDAESRYEEIRESYTEFEEGNNGSKYEITNLRNMLREVRDQKEKAIAMRNSADRERDEAIVRYDEKCREIERLEESFSQQFHSHGRNGGRSTTRTFFKGSRSASTLHEHEHEHDHGYEQEDE